MFDHTQAGASMNYTKNKMLYKLRYFRSDEFHLIGPRPEPHETKHNIGPMLGYIYSTKYFQAHYSGGLGVSWGTLRGDYLYSEGNSILFNKRFYEKDDYISPSIPMELELYFKPVKFMGIGVGTFLDLNLKSSTTGFWVKVSFGKLR